MFAGSHTSELFLVKAFSERLHHLERLSIVVGGLDEESEADESEIYHFSLVQATSTFKGRSVTKTGIYTTIKF